MDDSPVGTLTESGARRRPRRDRALRAVAVLTLGATLVAVAAVFTAVAGVPPARLAQLNSSTAMILQLVGMAGLALAGTAVVLQQARSVIAWLMSATALAWVGSYLTLVGALLLVDAGSPWGIVVGWATNWSWVPAQGLSMIMLLRFPTGRLPSRRWRAAEWAVVGWTLVTTLVTAFLPGPLGAEALSGRLNPVGVPALAPLADGLLTVLFAVMPVLVVVAAAAPVLRWRRAGTRERGALRWLAVAALAVAVTAPLAMITEAGEVLQGMAFLLLPTAIGIAVLREQLWDLDLRRRYDRLRAAREQERERLRHELHDSLGPVLGSISMRAEAARNLLAAGDASGADGLLASIGATTEGALAEVRRLIDDLSPGALEDRDLAPALVEHLQAYAHTFPVALRLEPEPLPSIEDRAAATAYLVVAEAVRNAARHSGGSRADVLLRAKGDRLLVEVRDDGRGLGDAPLGVGRAGMERRVLEEGGRLRVADAVAPARGTVVRLELPGAVR